MLSIIGGLFSILQMFMIAYNYGKVCMYVHVPTSLTQPNMQPFFTFEFHADDWGSIFGDPTKFGFGLVTVVFEVLHYFQHYVLYRRAWMKEYNLKDEYERSCKYSEKKIQDIVAFQVDRGILLKSVKYFDTSHT